MSAPVTVPTVPALARVERVELMHAGTWGIALGGQQTFTAADLAAAIAAQDCPAVRRPVVKLGHFDTRGNGMVAADGNRDGEPALGWVANLSLADSGRTLVGDLVGMPGWLGQIAASAYPDRSVEAFRNFTCQIGHKHPFVIGAVALLGVEPPGIGTLASLQDHASLEDHVRALYGVAASTEQPPDGEAVTFTVHASKEKPVADRPVQIAAAVTTDDVRKAFYDNAPHDAWICEIQLDPLQLIVTRDDGSYARVPVTVNGDGSFTFGPMVPVQVTYVDDPTPAVAASATPQRVRFGSRAESVPVAAAQTPEPSTGDPTLAGDTPTDVPAAEPENTQTQSEEDDVSDLSDVARRLGLPDGATKDEILATLDVRQPADPPAATTDPADIGGTVDNRPAADERELVAASVKPTLPAGVVTVETSTLEELKRNARLGAEAFERQRVADRDAHIDGAIAAGKFAPARREHWVRSWEADPEGTKTTIDGLEPGLVVPVAAAGRTGFPDEGQNPDAISTDEAAGWARHFGIPAEELTRG